MPSSITLDGLFVVAEDILKISFTSNVVVIPSYFYVDNFTLIGIGVSNPIITGVLPVTGRFTDTIYLQVSNISCGNTYDLTLNAEKIFDSVGDAIVSATVRFLMHRTKTDSVVRSLPMGYSRKNRSNVRAIVEAITISDEEIGGDF